MIQRIVQQTSMVAAWLALALIAYVTLSPIESRPVVGGLQSGHFVAFALMGLAFGLAYPRRLLLVISIVVGSAFLLEALQLLTPDRHARLLDAAVKAAGGICGIGVSQLWPVMLRTFARPGA